MTIFPKSSEWKVEHALNEGIAREEQSGSPSGHRYHIKRYLETFRWLPKTPGLLIDLGGACGIFGDILRDFTKHTLVYADHLGGEDVSRFDFERDTFPFADNHFDIVLFTEVLEHLSEDPMHALAEINRVLKPGGKLLLTTPNIASWKSLRRGLKGEHPGLFVQYMRHGGTDRHNREYTASEVLELMTDAGFEIIRADAIDVYDHVEGAEPIEGWNQKLRGDTTFCLAQKSTEVVNRRPNWLYWPPE